MVDSDSSESNDTLESNSHSGLSIEEPCLFQRVSVCLYEEEDVTCFYNESIRLIIIIYDIYSFIDDVRCRNDQSIHRTMRCAARDPQLIPGYQSLIVSNHVIGPGLEVIIMSHMIKREMRLQWIVATLEKSEGIKGDDRVRGGEFRGSEFSSNSTVPVPISCAGKHPSSEREWNAIFRFHPHSENVFPRPPRLSSSSRKCRAGGWWFPAAHQAD